MAEKGITKSIDYEAFQQTKNGCGRNEKTGLETFVHAVGLEIERAQVRLITAANAQMLFHYWKVGTYILYHQNLCQFARLYSLNVLRNLCETDTKLLEPDMSKIKSEILGLNSLPITREPLAQIQSTDNEQLKITQEVPAQIRDVERTVSAVYTICMEDMEKIETDITYQKQNQHGATTRQKDRLS